MPALEALVDQFYTEANTVTVGISVDSRYSHANWAWDLGGVSFPLLADFAPKGAVARSYGVYLEAAGITDRATVLIDREGLVRYAHSVGPGGKRDIAELLARAREIAAAQPPAATPPAPRGRLAEDATLFMREGCRFCAAVLRSMTNLHCRDQVRIRDVSQDPDARRELDRLAGDGSKVPVLLNDGTLHKESAEIIHALARLYARG